MPTKADDPNTFELSNGIRLTLHDASPVMIIQLNEEMAATEPQVPMDWSEAKNRDEPNADNPQYKAALQRWQMATGRRSLDILIPACVTVVDVPDGILAYDSNEWAEMVTEAYGFALKQGTPARMAQWVLYHATAPDIAELTALLFARAGAPQEEVQRALDGFRSDGQRGADTGSDANGASSADSPLQTPRARNRAQRRGAGSR